MSADNQFETSRARRIDLGAERERRSYWGYGVTAKDGVVTLMGHVENLSEKFAAEKAARRVNNIKAVAEEIEVRLPSSAKHDDEEIASVAIDRLKWDSAVPSDAVKVKVEKGWVTLTGQVD